MCQELHHTCKRCGKEYFCNDPNWICPTLNFDEEANICKECEKEYWEDLIALTDKEQIND